MSFVDHIVNAVKEVEMNGQKLIYFVDKRNVVTQRRYMDIGRKQKERTRNYT